tara:strand:+ start:8 stop:256 length:249 start_codon:yes stop_codon:yes gene_type:complete
MKITKITLRQIIKEELERTLSEENPLSGPTAAPNPLSGPTAAPNPLSGSTTADPVQGDKKQLLLVAKELQVLLAKIKKVIGQ